MCNEKNIEFVMNYTFSRTKIKEIIKRHFCLSLTHAYDIAHDENVMSSLIIIGSGRKQPSMFYRNIPRKIYVLESLFDKEL